MQRSYQVRTLTKKDLDSYNLTILPGEHADYVCRHCHNGWLSCAKLNQDGQWEVYRFPCHCTVKPGGISWLNLLDEWRYGAMQPDMVVDSLEELPKNCFIHPSANKVMLKDIPKYIVEDLPF